MPEAAPAPQQMPALAFVDEARPYSDQITTFTVTPGAAEQEIPAIDIPPAGYLRGVSIQVTASGGTAGSGVIRPEYPFNLFSRMGIENIDGSDMLYPMTGYAHYLAGRYTRPWDPDPARDPAFSASLVSPAFRQDFYIEGRATVGVVANTDARAQYRLRLTVATIAQMFSTAPTTPPTFTVTVNLEVYAQPPATSLQNVPIQQYPDGMAAQRFVSHQVIPANAGDNTLKLTRTGNLIRTLILVCRDSAGAPVALSDAKMRQRLDNSTLTVETPSHRVMRMVQRFLKFGQTATPPTGVYVWSYWMDPGNMEGEGWLETAQATFLGWDLTFPSGGGTIEVITEDLALAGPLPAQLENI